MLWIIAFVAVGSFFNYFLNRAPGSDPDDFRIGPLNSEISCDCFLNTLIIGAITAVMIILSASLFDSTTELLYTGVVGFLVVWMAGILGRMKRHAEWKEFDEVVRRAVPAPIFDEIDQERLDIAFEDEDEFKID